MIGTSFYEFLTDVWYNGPEHIFLELLWVFYSEQGTYFKKLNMHCNVIVMSCQGFEFIFITVYCRVRRIQQKERDNEDISIFVTFSMHSIPKT